MAGDNIRDRNLSEWSLEVFAIEPDFSRMTKIELRAYVIAHPNDKTAFHAFVDRLTSSASTETFDIPQSNAEVGEVDRLIKQKLADVKHI